MSAIRFYFITIGLILISIQMNAQVTASLTFDLSDLTLDTIDIYTQPSFPGCQFTDIVGAPHMPVIIKQYVLPKNAEITSISISDSSHSTLPGSYLIFPAQTPYFLDGSQAPPFVEPDTEYYSSNSRFNGDIIELESLTNKMGYYLAKLRIYPLQYIPADSELIFFDTLRFTINYQLTGTDSLIEQLTAHQYYEIVDYLTQLVENPNDIKSYGAIADIIVPAYEGIRPLNLFFLPGAGGDNIEYLIITNELLKDEFEALAAWKMSKGIPAMVVTTSQIEEYYPGFDLAEKIFNYLKDVYDHWGSAYVLLGGDTEIIPTRITSKEDHGSGGIYDRVSDLYYGDVFKANYPSYNWNPDGDGDFTNNYSSLDLNAEHLIGRAPVHSIIEAEHFVNKVLYYEQSSFSSYKYTLIGADLSDCGGFNYGVSGWMEPVYEKMVPGQQNNTMRIYDAHLNWPGSVELNANNVLESLGGGEQPDPRYIFAHIDHSGFSSLGTSQRCNNQNITIKDFDAMELQDGDIPKIMYSGGCDPNEFNKDCVAEHFINGKGDFDHHGIGIGFIGNSGGGTDSEDQCFELFDKLLFNPAINLGKIFDVSRNAVADEEGHCQQRNLNLLGDPELPVWTSGVNDLSVSYNLNSLTTGMNVLEVALNNISYEQKGFVTIYKENEVYGAKETEDSVYGPHKVTFECKPDTKGDLRLIATGPNKIYYETTLVVEDFNPNVHLYIKSLNPEGLIIHKGDNSFEIELENTGHMDGIGISSTLTVTKYNNFVTLINNKSEFPDIVKEGSSEFSIDKFEIHITDDATDLLFIPFNLEIRCNDDEYVFNEEFFLQVKTPQLTYRGNKILTTSDDDIFVEPSEIVYFKVELLNYGSLGSKAISASISESSLNIEHIITDTVYFREMDSHDTVWCNDVFEIQMANQLMQSNNFPLTLTVNYDGISQSIPITIANESVPDEISFTSTDSEIILSWSPDGDDAHGFNIYRLYPDDLPPGKDIEDSTCYQRLNFFINQFSSFKDEDVEPSKTYYYKLTLYSSAGLPQGPFTPAFKAWTTLPELDPWPIFIPENGTRSEGSPILCNVIHEREQTENPELEIFFPMSDADATIGALYGFYSTGEELYNIDQNITTYAGFVNFANVGLKATPIVGIMHNDPNNNFGDVAFATIGGGEEGKKIFMYSTGDLQEPFDFPDEYWETNEGNIPGLGQPVKHALVGVNSLDGGNTVSIIAAEIYHGMIDVRNAFSGERIGNWPKTVPFDNSNPNDIEVITLGIPVAADLDLDSYKEVIIGCDGSKGSNGIFIFKYNGDNYQGQANPPVPVFGPVTETGFLGFACRPVVANLDQSDANPEILLLGAYNNYKAQIFALDYLGNNEVTNWEFENSEHLIDISTSLNGNYPALTVADLDGDGSLEVIVADAGKVYAWNASGDLLNENFPIEVEGLACPTIAPLIANLDQDPGNEIIIASSSNEDFIYAFNADGSLVPGWPLVVDGLHATPAIGDINHDGLNEIVAVYGGYVNVWKTEGETGHDQWPLYRQNTFNNAAYEEPACEYDPNDPLVYEEENNQINWDGYNVLTSDLIIPDGEILIIEGRVAMPDGAKIIVQQGGRLEVTGGVITSACSGFWKGIEVWGYSDKSQLDEAFPPGVIILSDNAKVENAECAIATIKIVNNQADYDCTGGIVIAKHTTFLNNIYGVMFYDYTNFIPVPPYTEINNRSYFEVCDFLTNGDLAIPGCTPKAFLWMNNVFGISLYGNYFVNSTGNKWSWYDRGIGIETYFSVYTIDEGCMTNIIPCDDIRKSYFNNLYYGIKSSGNGMPNRVISVAHTIFDLNQHGIFISTMDNAHVLFNTFNIAKRANNIDPYNYGLYVEYSTGYSIEENTFSEKSLGFYNNIGMYISNSGRAPNEVYKNDFKNLEYGIVAYGQNRDEEGAGLCLKCNNFVTCKNDIHVIPEKDEQENWLRGRPQGIAFMQGTGGSYTAPAGNTFTDVEELSTTFNYFNHENCNLIDYHNHITFPDEAIIIPNPHSDNVHLSPEDENYMNEDHACPSNFGGGSLNLNFERSITISEAEQVIVYSDSIQELKDGGDTYSLNLDVYASTAEEAYELRQQLLDESPYLSDTVMKSAILKENVLPNAMIRDVLVSNPQSAKSSEILEKVEERLDPMPEEMLVEILEGRTVRGNLEILEDRLASHQTRAFTSLRKLEWFYKQDTLDFQGSQDSLINLWKSLTDPSIRYKLTFLYLHKGDSLNCFSMLNSIPQLNDLSPRELNEFSKFSELVSLLWTMRNSTLHLDSLAANLLFSLAESRSIPGVIARNMLVAAGLTDYQEPIYLSDNLKSTRILPEKLRNHFNNNQRLKVFPNPATDYFILSYDLTGLQGNFFIEIINPEGKALIRQNLSGTENQIVISTASLTSSPHILRLISESSCIETIRFIILK